MGLAASPVGGVEQQLEGGDRLAAKLGRKPNGTMRPSPGPTSTRAALRCSLSPPRIQPLRSRGSSGKRATT